MKLLSLELKNFKGLTFTLEPQGESVDVFGANATGKTTLADANCWLLFDKDSQFRSQFEIKTLDVSGKAKSGLKHAVTGKYELDDGQVVELQKVYYEKWVKPKGRPEAEFRGHTTDYYIDEVPAKKKEYTDKVAEIADLEIFKLLSSPFFFSSELHWQDRRKTLLEICGDISDADVIASSKDLGELLLIAEKRTLEEHKRMITAKRQAINKDLDRIPVRIDEQDRGRHDISRYKLKDVASELERFLEGKKQAEKELDDLNAGGGVKGKEEEVAQAKKAVTVAMNADEESIELRIKSYRQQSQDIALDIKSNDSRLGRSEGYLAETFDPAVKRIEVAIEDERKHWHDVYENELDPICGECGQKVPAEINIARKQALLDKSDADGLNLKKELEKVNKEKAVFEAKMQEIRQENNDLLVKQKKLEAKIKDAEKELLAVEPDKKLMDEVIKLEKELAKMKEGDNSEASMKLASKIVDLNGEIHHFEEIIAQFKENDKIDARIEELKEERTRLSREFEKIERELFLIQQFTKTKVSLLEEHINSQFRLAKFKLATVQVNGEIDDCCEVTYNGVPFNSGLNHGAQIAVGLDIISTIQGHYDTSVPVFVDNREAVSGDIEFDGQMISLIVNDSDVLEVK